MVQQPSQSIEKNSTKTQTHKNQQKTKTKHKQAKPPPKPNKQATWKVIGGPVQRLVKKVRLIILYQLRYWYGRKQDKRRHTNTNITLPYVE